MAGALMQPSRKELRPYQVRLVTDVCRAAGDVLVEQPTGSGKTMQIVTLVAMHLGRRFTHAVIAATPYRGDGRPVALEGMRLLRRSLAEHMAEGFGPRHLDSEVVALGRPGDAITAGQFTGEDAPPPSYFDGLVAAICRKWVDDG